MTETKLMNIPMKTHDKNDAENDQDERDNQFCCSSGACVTVGYLMVNGIDEKRLLQKYRNARVFHFSQTVELFYKNPPSNMIM